MTAGFTLNGFGASSLRSATRSSAAVDVYVSASSGSDSNPGTQTAPLQTLAKLESLLPEFLDHEIVVHLDRGPHMLPDSGRFLRSRCYNAQLRLFADEAWDPQVVQVTRTAAAAAATSGTVVMAAGLVVNMFRDQTIEFLSGAAAGQRRRIIANTATDILPARTFSPAPAAGDSYRIFNPRATVRAPNPAGSTGYIFAQDGAGLIGQFGANPQPPFRGLALQGLLLEGSAGFPRFQFGQLPVQLLGVDALTGFGTDSALAFNDAEVLSGADADFSVTALSGWGYRGIGMPLFRGNCQFRGSVNLSADLQGSSDATSDLVVLGGRAFRFFGASDCLVSGDDPAIPFLLDTRGTASQAVSVSMGFLQLDIVSVFADADAITVEQSGQASITPSTVGESTAGLSVRVYRGGRMFLQGAPAFGDAVALDWDVDDGAPFNKSFFAAPGDTKFFNGNLIVRAL